MPYVHNATSYIARSCTLYAAYSRITLLNAVQVPNVLALSSVTCGLCWTLGLRVDLGTPVGWEVEGLGPR